MTYLFNSVFQSVTKNFRKKSEKSFDFVLQIQNVCLFLISITTKQLKKTVMRKVATFEKSTFNADFDHQSNVKEIFESLGYTDFSIKTSLTNGCSHYVSLCLNIANAGKLPYDAWTFDDTIVITVRISDHASNLEKFGGWEGQSNRCTLSFFKHLRDTGAIALSN